MKQQCLHLAETHSFIHSFTHRNHSFISKGVCLHCEIRCGTEGKALSFCFCLRTHSLHPNMANRAQSKWRLVLLKLKPTCFSRSANKRWAVPLLSYFSLYTPWNFILLRKWRWVNARTFQAKCLLSPCPTPTDYNKFFKSSCQLQIINSVVQQAVENLTRQSFPSASQPSSQLRQSSLVHHTATFVV